jgi:hypothetical protein
MNKWEYKVYKDNFNTKPEKLEKEINKLIKEGWELFESHAFALGHLLFIFRREKK